MHRNDRILVVDDVEDNLLIIDELLGEEFIVICVKSGEEALRVAPCFRPNLVLMDIMMPGIDGWETSRRIRALPALDKTRIVMLSAKSDIEDRLTAYECGAVDYITKPFHTEEVRAKVRAWMLTVSRQELEDIWREAERAREAVGLTMATLSAFRDSETGEHLFRMRWYSLSIAEQLAFGGAYHSEITEDFLQQLYRASPLHDIGKVAIDDAILRKPGPLTPEEFESMKNHAVLGSHILTRAAEQLPNVPYLRMAASIARHHHERFDGTGYPDGLAGHLIPLPARIVAVADVFDAITSCRVYKLAMSVDEAVDIISAQAGMHFDPAIVDAFLMRLDDFRQAHSRFADGSLSSQGIVGQYRSAAVHEVLDFEPEVVGASNAAAL